MHVVKSPAINQVTETSSICVATSGYVKLWPQTRTALYFQGICGSRKVRRSRTWTQKKKKKKNTDSLSLGSTACQEMSASFHAAFVSVH